MKKYIQRWKRIFERNNSFFENLLAIVMSINVLFIIILLMVPKWAQISVNSLILKVFEIDDNVSLIDFLFELLFLLVFYNVLIKVISLLINKTDSKHEYREYLLKELDRKKMNNSEADGTEKAERDDHNEDVINNIKNSNKNVKEEPKQFDNKDIIALMLKNNDEITEYFKISKSQAKSSFWFSVIFCIVGMAALAIGIYGVVILKDVSISVISLISGSISELISGTIFWVHNKSALQLNHYYDALHENEKFLSAISIADKLSTRKREEMLVEIIREQICSKAPNIKTEKDTNNKEQQ